MGKQWEKFPAQDERFARQAEKQNNSENTAQKLGNHRY